MKGVKGKFLKKLKSMKPIGYLKQERVFHVPALDGFLDTFPKSLPHVLKARTTQLASQEPELKEVKETSFLDQAPEVIDVSELMRDLEEKEDEEIEVDGVEDKENVSPSPRGKSSEIGFDNEKEDDCKEMVSSSSRQIRPLAEIDISSFRRPDLNSGSLFDPNLLAAFGQAVKEHFKVSEVQRQARIEQQDDLEKIMQEERQASVELAKDLDKRWESRSEEENLERCLEEPPLKARRIDEEAEDEEAEDEEEEGNPLLCFEERCPPGGSDSVILYTTTLRGIRKTFEDCNSIRFLLESFRVLFFERDVSMHVEFKEELWKVLECKAMPPKLFIKGRYIGGAEEVLVLHEQGKFRVLFEGIPIDQSIGPCDACAGVRFVLCFRCSGSHRVIADDGSSNNCSNCNENGLIICPLCC